MGITSINLQTIVELTAAAKVSWLYHPSIGEKLIGTARSQHAATTSQECLCVTVLLYLKQKSTNDWYHRQLFMYLCVLTTVTQN